MVLSTTGIFTRGAKVAEPICMGKEYVLVIDTDSPSFSFYRQLCAYCTGYEHEGVSTIEISDRFYSDFDLDDDDESSNPFYDYLDIKLDENGHLSPCCVWLNPRYGRNTSGDHALLDENNYEQFSGPAPLSVGFYFGKMPTRHHIEMIKSRAKAFLESCPPMDTDVKVVKFEGLRLICHTRYAEEIPLD